MKDDYQKELFERLLKSPALEKQKAAFGPILKDSIWWISDGTGAGKINSLGDNITCDKKKVCSLKPLEKAIAKSKKSGQLQRFICPSARHGFCMPLIQGDKIYGFITICHTKEKTPDDILTVFTAFGNALLREIQKELELFKLYEGIRPRAIALSTTHTVHRLISSTLDLNELLPRLARLCLQVLRAKRCSILLVDRPKRFLIPRTTIDLNYKNSKIKRKKVKIGVGREGRVAQENASIFKPSYLCVPLLEQDTIGVITVSQHIDKKPFSVFDQEILTVLAEQAVVAIKNAQLYAEQEKLTLGSIKALAAILNERAPHKHTHSMAFVDIVSTLGREMKLSLEEKRSLHYAALLHDAGKLAVPREILTKSSKLTGKEYNIIKEHPVKGAEIIKPLGTLKPVVSIILYHHEHYNGKGYPRGLKGKQIPLEARIMAVADAFEAMVCGRPYRKIFTVLQAASEIKKNSGSQFDPQVVRAFLKIVKRGEIKQLLKRKGYAIK